MDRIEEIRARREEQKTVPKEYQQRWPVESIDQLLTALAEKDDEIKHHLLVLGESATSEAEKDKRITLLEAVVDASKGLFGGDGRLATSETCRNCVNTMARMLKVGDALAALGKEGS